MFKDSFCLMCSCSQKKKKKKNRMFRQIRKGMVNNIMGVRMLLCESMTQLCVEYSVK